MSKAKSNKLTKYSSNQLQTPFLTLEALSEWSQAQLTTSFKDIIVHFVFSFSSINTRRSYLTDLKEFYLFLQSLNISLITDIDEKVLIQWQQILYKKGTLNQKSIRRKLLVLSSVFMFCIKRKLIEKNPLDFIQKPKLTFESKTHALTLEEVKLILKHLEEKCTYHPSIKNQKSREFNSNLLAYTVISTLLSVGMRVNELCQLKIKHIEKNNEFTRLHLKVKGNEEHAPIIHPKTAKIIENYLSQCRPHAKDEDYVFLRSQQALSQSKLSQVAVYKMLSKVTKELGIEKKITPHSCRATLATLLHNQGTPIGEIQALLNHKEISTTALYVKKANELDEAAALKLKLDL